MKTSKRPVTLEEWAAAEDVPATKMFERCWNAAQLALLAPPFEAPDGVRFIPQLEPHGLAPFAGVQFVHLVPEHTFSVGFGPRTCHMEREQDGSFAAYRVGCPHFNPAQSAPELWAEFLKAAGSKFNFEATCGAPKCGKVSWLSWRTGYCGSHWASVPKDLSCVVDYGPGDVNDCRLVVVDEAEPVPPEVWDQITSTLAPLRLKPCACGRKDGQDHARNCIYHGDNPHGGVACQLEGGRCTLDAKRHRAYTDPDAPAPLRPEPLRYCPCGAFADEPHVTTDRCYGAQGSEGPLDPDALPLG